MNSPTAYTLLFGLALASAGCSASKDEMSKTLEEVQREITSLRASNSALKDRLDMLETTPMRERAAAGAEPSPESSDRPALEVVHLSPEEEPAAPSAVVAPIDDRPAVDIVGDDTGVKQVDPNEEAPEPKAKTAAAQYPKKRGR